MIAFALAAAWQVLLFLLAPIMALTGRMRPQSVEADLDEAYELGRWRERTSHQRRVREEELAELRRRDAVGAS